MSPEFDSQLRQSTHFTGEKDVVTSAVLPHNTWKGVSTVGRRTLFASWIFSSSILFVLLVRSSYACLLFCAVGIGYLIQ